MQKCKTYFSWDTTVAYILKYVYFQDTKEAWRQHRKWVIFLLVTKASFCNYFIYESNDNNS